MIQEILYVPFPGNPNPDVAGLRQRTFDWFRSCGMLNTDAAIHKHISTDIADLGGRWHPTTTGENLDLPTCAVTLAVIIDDQIDGDLDKRPDLVAQLVNDLNNVMYPDPPARNFPDSVLVHTFAKLWEWSVQGMSAWWCARLRTAWEQFNNAFIVETQNRFMGRMMPVDEYIPFRRESGYMYIEAVYLEKVLGFEVPRELLAMPQIREMIQINCDIISIGNDIHSLEKEEKRGDIHNIAMLLQHERRCSRQEAIEITCQMISGWSARFYVLEKEIPGLCQSFGLSEAMTTSMQEYAVGLGRLIGGYCAWGRISKRYHIANALSSDQQGHPESYL